MEYIYIIVGKSQSSFSSSTAWFLITSLQLPEEFHFKVVIIMRMKWSEVAQSCLPLLTLWTVAYQAPLFMGFSKQEYWSGLPFPAPEDLPDPGIEPRSPAL